MRIRNFICVVFCFALLLRLDFVLFSSVFTVLRFYLMNFTLVTRRQHTDSWQNTLILNGMAQVCRLNSMIFSHTVRCMWSNAVFQFAMWNFSFTFNCSSATFAFAFYYFLNLGTTANSILVSFYDSKLLLICKETIQRDLHFNCTFFAIILILFCLYVCFHFGIIINNWNSWILKLGSAFFRFSTFGFQMGCFWVRIGISYRDPSVNTLKL